MLNTISNDVKAGEVKVEFGQVVDVLSLATPVIDAEVKSEVTALAVVNQEAPNTMTSEESKGELQEVVKEQPELKLVHINNQSVTDSEKNKGKKKDGKGKVAEEPVDAPGFNMSEAPVEMVEVDRLKPSKLNFFKPLSAEKYQELYDSIQSNGILVPLIARPIKGGKLEILAGHNRYSVAKSLKLSKAPVRIIKVDDDKAKEIIVDTNVTQRTEFTPMEIAKAYEEKKRIIGKRQGQRSDISGEAKGATRDIIASELKVSGMTVDRYLRLNNLIPEYQELVDKGDMNVKTGMELGLLDHEHQKMILNLNEGEQVNSAKIGEVRKALKDKNKLTKEEKKQAKEKGQEPVMKPLTPDEVIKLLAGEQVDESRMPVKISIEFPLGELDEDVRELLKMIQEDRTVLFDILKKYAHGKLVEDIGVIQ